MSKIEFCRRCGEMTFLYTRVLAARAHLTNTEVKCHHIGTGKVTSAEWAERIRAAYEMGKRFNPEHDITDYAEQTKYRPSIHRVKETVTDARDNGDGPLSLSAALTATVGGVVMAGHHHEE
jgi:hypothetical protein